MIYFSQNDMIILTRILSYETFSFPSKTLEKVTTIMIFHFHKKTTKRKKNNNLSENMIKEWKKKYLYLYLLQIWFKEIFQSTVLGKIKKYNICIFFFSIISSTPPFYFCCVLSLIEKWNTIYVFMHFFFLFRHT